MLFVSPKERHIIHTALKFSVQERHGSGPEEDHGKLSDEQNTSPVKKNKRVEAFQPGKKKKAPGTPYSRLSILKWSL